MNVILINVINNFVGRITVCGSICHDSVSTDGSFTARAAGDQKARTQKSDAYQSKNPFKIHKKSFLSKSRLTAAFKWLIY
jgi:hypothetical protein